MYDFYNLCESKNINRKLAEINGYNNLDNRGRVPDLWTPP